MAEYHFKMHPKKNYDALNKSVKIFVFGKPVDWKSEKKKSEKIISSVAREEKIKEVFAPDSSPFNKKIAGQKEFKKPEKFTGNISYFKGVKAEGIELKLNQAAWFLVADCFVIVARDFRSGKTLTAHAGRDSLHPLSTAGKNKSIVYSIMEHFPKSKFSPADIFVHILEGIGPKNFYHPSENSEKGRKNKKIILYLKKELGSSAEWLYGNEKDGRLNLFEIIKRQFALSKVPLQNISRNNIETFSDKDKRGKFMWHSHRRGDKGRNGIAIVRKN